MGSSANIVRTVQKISAARETANAAVSSITSFEHPPRPDAVATPSATKDQERTRFQNRLVVDPYSLSADAGGACRGHADAGASFSDVDGDVCVARRVDRPAGAHAGGAHRARGRGCAP
jgi:hypothetical protein